MANQHGRLRGFSVGAALAAMTMAAAAHAQRFGSGPVQVAAGNPFGILTLLARADVRDELDLIGDQLESLRRLNGTSRQKLRERFAELRIGGLENARKRIQEMGTELRQELDQELEQILLPHQVERLKQLHLQYRMRNSALFLTDAVAQQLGVAGDQRQQLRDRGRELAIEFQRNVSSLRADAQRQLVALLTAEQQRKLNELIGQPFQFIDRPASSGGRVDLQELGRQDPTRRTNRDR